jgi:hypothetical protein
MKIALQIFSWIGIVLGFFAVLGSLEGGADAAYSFFGGALFFTQGLLALIYISQNTK